MENERNDEVKQTKRGFWRRHRVLQWTLLSLLAVFVVLFSVATVAMRRAEPLLRARIVAELEERFHSHVELDSFHVSVASGLRAEGKGLRVWPAAARSGSTDILPPGNPLISLQEFRFHAPLSYSFGKPIHISLVQLKGLSIDLPPRPPGAYEKTRQPIGESSGKPSTGDALLRFQIDGILVTDAHLKLETNKPGKLPLQFDIARIKLSNIKEGGAMDFDAQLTNARPRGAISTQGTVGPWDTEDLGESEIRGKYDFEHADLGDFKGIAGMLNSTGRYQGTLRDLTVDGVTDTPDFRLTNFGTSLPLHTSFHAKVDGTNGDTWLEPVSATLGQSSFTAQGQIVRVPQTQADIEAAGEPAGSAPQSKGHDVSLFVNVPQGRMDDFMRLTSKSGTPLLTGIVTVKTTLEIPPGKEPVHHRIKLKGSFTLQDVLFSSQKIQERITDMSLRAQGDSKQIKDADRTASVRSTMSSQFSMGGGVITLPDLLYSIPGADIALSGTYGIESGALNFSGTAKMEATVSKMVGGWKGFLLKPADRLFKKDGAGTEVPISIDGTREEPHFKVDFGRLKNTSPERPGGDG